jgi:FkbH-like protein
VEGLTEESRRRREFYQAELQRQAAERDWGGRRLEFLRSCQIRLTLRPAGTDDVARIAELIERTNQLNTAAQRFNQPDVLERVNAPGYRLTVARMADRFGDYGIVGVLMARELGREWVIEVLLVSCRVIGRGVGEALLCYGLRQAQVHGQRAVRALYRRTAYNRAMQLLFVTHGFKRDREQDGLVTYAHDLGFVPDYPAWLEVQAP